MARNTAATDAGVGQASFTTRLKLTVQAARKCTKYGGIPLFILPLCIWAFSVSPQGIDVVKLRLIAAYAPQDMHRKWMMRDESGERRVITVKSKNGQLVQYMTPDEIRTVTAPISGPFYTFIEVLFGSFATFGFGFWLVWRYFVKLGEQQQKNRRIRGAYETVTQKELAKLVKERGESEYTLVDVPLPADAPMRGIIAVGAQGTGKSLALHDFLTQIVAKKRKAVIYDPTGEYFRAYYRPGIDAFFNPALEGSVPFSVFAELKYTYDANTLAEAFLPPKSSGGQQGANVFFEDAARALFSVIVLRLVQCGAVDTCDIAKAFLEMPEEEMAILIQNSVASSAIGGDSKGQRQGVISSIAIYLDGIASVNRGNWSISEFLDQPGDARLFIHGTEDTEAMFAPLYRLMLTVAFSAIAAKQEVVHYDRYWFFLDEIHTLGDIRIDEVLAELRKYGVAVIAGTQNDGQFVTKVGKDRAETIMNGFNTLLQLRVNDAEAKKRAAERMDKTETETVSQNQALAVVEQRDGAGIVINEQEKWVVMPGEIGQLADCVGYLKLSGDYPIAKVDYQHWRPARPGAKARLDRFKPVQSSPPRDPRFRVSRPTLPAGATAFDDVKKAADVVRAQAKNGQTLTPVTAALTASAQPDVDPSAVDMGNGPTTAPSSGGSDKGRDLGKSFDMDL